MHAFHEHKTIIVIVPNQTYLQRILSQRNYTLMSIIFAGIKFCGFSIICEFKFPKIFSKSVFHALIGYLFKIQAKKQRNIVLYKTLPVKFNL